MGVNGSGKTTIVKMLCGLIQPDSGQILVDGRGIGQMKKEDLFSLISAVFQETYIPPFMVCEAVSLKLKRETDPARVRQALAQAGLLPEIEKYPEGIYTKMGKEVHDGIILSGGQQQKLLMARALYKDAPILILDEPTAALDPIAESETYQSFHQLSQNKTSVYISHRLASTRFCDKIILLK